jgi:HEAT repeat protein
VRPPPPKTITSVDDAVNWLRSPSEDERKKGAEWLQRSPVDPVHQADVSRQLEANLSDNNEDVAEAAAKALVPWATKDNVPELIRRVEDQAFGFRAGKLRPHAIAALTRLKDARAAPALAARLSDNDSREKAREALIAIGRIGGEAEVRKQLSNPKKEVRDAAVAILATYGVKENFTLTQALADVKSTGPRGRDTRENAAGLILGMPVDEKRRAEVLQALEEAMQERGPFTGERVIRAYGAWATKENIPTIAKQLDHPNGAARQATIDILTKFPDARSVKALVERLSDRGDRAAVSKAIQTLGTDQTLTNTTETEVLSLLESSTDRDTRVECCRILGAVGTKAVSLPVLMKLDQDTMKVAQQRALNAAAKNAASAITLRGK